MASLGYWFLSRFCNRYLLDWAFFPTFTRCNLGQKLEPIEV